MAVTTGKAQAEKSAGEKANGKPAEAPKAVTEYMVLARVEGAEESWKPLGSAEGQTALVAIKAMLGTDNPAPGAYRAVPMRSWQAPFEVISEQKVVVSFRQAAE